jgi:uncharacterized protein (TIGR00730 family)
LIAVNLLANQFGLTPNETRPTMAHDSTASLGKMRIPQPAHPDQRQQPLPWQQPKSSDEDPDAPSRVSAILASPSYRLAEQDLAFLGRDDTRGVRLQIEYLKPETLLEEHAIRDTIVVYGSTRIPEPAAARRGAEALRQALETDPRNDVLIRQLAVAERLLAKSRYYEIAREFGRLVGSSCNDDGSRSKLVIMTGGGPGIMEAANRGAFDVGAKSVGLNINLPHEQYPNPYITPDLCLRFHYFALRKMHLLLRAKALVAFPGGFGTMDELFEVLTLVQTRKITPVPIVLVGQDYWRRAFDVGFLADEGVIDAEDRELFWFAETAQEIWDGILHWYDACGAPLGVKA